jgi:mono/diheme cytochrome c family protein
MNAKYFVIGFFGLGVVVAISKAFMPAAQDPHSVQSTSGEQGAPLVVVKLPKLSSAAEVGKNVFEANCAACHGVNAAGQDGVAPPLVHKIYEPNHHADISFARAAKNGVRAHHWRFGNMPQIKGVDEEEVAQIVTYVRELQRANGIQ